MNLFVSYTRRDGIVTDELLLRLNVILKSTCNPFIHVIEAENLLCQQLGVVLALLRSDAVLLLTSPAVHKSPWVRLELMIARLLFLPIISLDAKMLHNAVERAWRGVASDPAGIAVLVIPI